MLIFLVLGAVVILGVIAFNMYQENKYRQQVRAQFGHSDKDALMEKDTRSVRDGRLPGHQAKAPLVKPLRKKDISELPTEDMFDQMAAEAAEAERAAQAAVSKGGMGKSKNQPKVNRHDVEVELEEDEFGAAFALDLDAELEKEAKAESGFRFKNVEVPVPSQTKEADKKGLLLDLDDMIRQELPWFNHNFDYMAFLSMKVPQELHALPRFAGRSRFRIAGCTMDDRWQIAEPIPSVYYQGFVVGLQAISRNGLATAQELERFGEQVNAFAQQLDAGLLLMDVQAFLKNALPLDELCARVDQTIAMHLVSRGSVSGVELSSVLQKAGFRLGHDGAFHLAGPKGDPLFSIVTLDNSPFTASLLSSQAYRGFSMLFDITRVPAGEKYFNKFMDIAVNFSGSLGLDLVDDNMNELSPEWLKNVRSFVLARQEEMKKVGIEPGGELASRLFS